MGWLTNRGRRMLKTEMTRLQGMDPTKFTVAVSENRLGHQLGNTMSVCVLERLFTQILPAAKLVRGTIKDRWASGQALKKLMATRGKGFPCQPFSTFWRCNKTTAMIWWHVLGMKFSSIVQAAGFELGTMDMFFTSTFWIMI